MANDNIPGEVGQELSDFSGMLQRKTSFFLRKPNELWTVENADQAIPGAISKVKGYTQRASDLTTKTTTSTSSSTTTTSTSSSTSMTTSTSTTHT